MPDDVRTPADVAPSPASAAVTPELLYRLHRASLLTVAALMLDDREQAKEVVHDAFVELIARWDTIDSDHALGYLYRAVSNRSRSWLRRRRTARSYRPEVIPVVAGADTAVLRADGYTTILQAVRGLPTKQRQVIVLRYYAELDLRRTAQAMGISENAVAVNTHRALKSLRQLRGELS